MITKFSRQQEFTRSASDSRRGPGDVLARLGGDEFAILQARLDSPDDGEAHVYMDVVGQEARDELALTW